MTRNRLIRTQEFQTLWLVEALARVFQPLRVKKASFTPILETPHRACTNQRIFQCTEHEGLNRNSEYHVAAL